MATTSITPVVSNGHNQVDFAALQALINSGKIQLPPQATTPTPKPAADRPKPTVIVAKAPTPTFTAPAGPETPEQELARLRAENAALKTAKSHSALSLRVSEKGALSLYGMGKFPVTLYREQWERLLAAKDEIEGFIVDHMDELKSKGQ